MRFFLTIQFALIVSLTLLIPACGSTPGKFRTSPGETRATQRSYTVNHKVYYPIASADGYRETGIASWYGSRFHGKRTANGEVFDMHASTAAHKTLPMNTILLVQNLENGKETVVRINDRGPFTRKRIIDLSYLSASRLDMLKTGTARVRIIALGEAPATAAKKRLQPERLKHQDFNRGRFYVQIGSFLNRNNAERQAHRFVDQGTKAVIQPYFTPEKTFYRVQVFADASLANARNFEKQLIDNGYPNAFVIAR